MDKNWNEQSLGSLRIHELRDLARKVGVKCPTALKKEELITQTMQILKGETEPYKALNKKGRPSKSDSQVNTLVEFFMPEDVDSEVVEYKPYANFDFFVNMPPAEYNVDSENVEGLVEITPKGYGIVRTEGYNTSDKDIFVHEMIVSKNNLKSGDYVKGCAKAVIGSPIRTMSSIASVNKDIPKVKASYVVLGDRQYNISDSVLLLSKESNGQALEDFKKSQEGIGIYVSAYDKINHNSSVEKIYATTSPFKSYKDIFCCYNMAFNRANVLSNKSSVTLVINSIASFYRALEGMLCEKVDNPVKLNKLVQETLLKYFENAKKNNVTLVVYDYLNQEQRIKEFLEFELKNIVDYSYVI